MKRNITIIKNTLIVLIFLIAPLYVQAQFPGSGTEIDPYLISSKADMQTLASTVSSSSGKYYLLTNDITTAVTTVIGTSSTDPFLGTFDGGGHTVSINIGVGSSSAFNRGVFGYINNATIKNLKVTGSIQGTVSLGSNNASYYAGGICGYANNSTIINCYNVAVISPTLSGTLYIHPYAGGICGRASNTMITNCRNLAYISLTVTLSGPSASAGSSYVGGICGYGGTIANCYNTENCIALRTVTSAPASQLAWANVYVGGICGSTTYSVTNSSNTGNISATANSSSYNSTAYAGGICGSSGTITNCWTGNASITTSPNLNFAGRIIGVSTVQNCYALATMQVNGVTISSQDPNSRHGQDANIIPIPPTITTTSLPSCAEGSTYSQSLSSNGSTPITWTLANGNLPTGLTILTDGTISGIPTAAGTFVFTVQAMNSMGYDTKELSILVNPYTNYPNITTNSLQDGILGTFYNQSLTATGITPITWSLVSGSLPTNLTLSTAGVISGLPMTAGVFNFTIMATNSLGNITKNFSITIFELPTITTTTLSNGFVGTTYNTQLTATGTTPLTWSLETGALPNGLTLSATGIISGIPIAAGTSNFTVKVVNSAGSSIKPLSISVSTSTISPTITTTTLPDGMLGSTYSAQLDATGTAPITWSLANGNLPTGLTLYSGGTISGTSTTTGTHHFTVQAMNSAGNATKALSIKIEDGVGISEIEISEIMIYPNPTTGDIKIESGNFQVWKVEILDIAGRTILVSQETSINISQFPPGTYFLKLTTETKILTKKVIKE